MFKVRFVISFLLFIILSACSGRLEPSQPVAEITASETPVPATEIPTQIAAVPTATARPTLAPNEWMTLPIVPTVSDAMREVYQRGLEMGNDPNAFSKVGDCQTNTDFYLVDFDHAGWYRLGDQYAYLQDTIDYYQGSFSRTSLAMRDGYNVAAILTPFRADPKKCEKGETPVACEYRIYHPSVALISLETNFNSRPAADYGKYMRQIIEYTLSQGIVPILATKADNKEGDNSINAEIAKIAFEYDIPLWNFWAAAQPLPHHGLMNDGFHLYFARNFFDDPEKMLSSWPWRNLTALQALDAVRVGLSTGGG